MAQATFKEWRVMVTNPISAKQNLGKLFISFSVCKMGTITFYIVSMRINEKAHVEHLAWCQNQQLNEGYICFIILFWDLRTQRRTSHYIYIKRLTFWRLERWLSSWEHQLLFQRTQVQFLALTQRFLTTCNSSPGRSSALF